MKLKIFFVWGIVCLIFLVFLLSSPHMPPISREYATRKIEGKSTEGIDKFQKGWQWKDPFFYIEIFLLLLGVSFIIMGIKEKTNKQ